MTISPKSRVVLVAILTEHYNAVQSLGLNHAWNHIIYFIVGQVIFRQVYFELIISSRYFKRFRTFGIY